MDPFGHPDLDRLARSMRNKLDETLDAEQAAARAAALRRTTIRDRLIELSDRSGVVLLSTVDGHVASGEVVGVGVDHVVLLADHRERFIAIGHVVSMEPR
ncbi:MAG: hypothetical protein ACR2N7_04940 [Acidimicrobiia bacterium]